MDRLCVLAIASVIAAPEMAKAEPPTVSPSEIVDFATTATAHDAPDAVPGASTIIATMGSASPDVLAATRAALAAAAPALVVVDDASRGDELLVTLEAANHARVTVALDAIRGSIRLTPRLTHAKLAGACVAVPTVLHPVDVNSQLIDQSGDLLEGTTYWGLRTELLYDVDGDGIQDAFVPVAASPNACPEAVSWRVYVRRGACGYEVGTVGPGQLQPSTWDAAIDASGLRPLTVVEVRNALGERGIPQVTTTTRVFARKRGRYAEQSKSTSVGTCYHCATWRCRASN